MWESLLHPDNYLYLVEQTKEFDGKRIEIMDKTAKFKGKDEISKFLSFEYTGFSFLVNYYF